MSSLKPGSETNIGLTYRLLSDLPRDAHLTLYYEPGIQWRGGAARPRGDRGCGHQPADPARLPVPGAQLPARGQGRPDGLFARGLCGAVTGGADRPDGPSARRADRRGDARPGLRSLPECAGKPCGTGAAGCALPRSCGGRLSRGLRHGARSGHPLAHPLAVRAHAAPLPFPRVGSVDARGAACAGAGRDAGGLCAGAVGRGARARGQRRGAAGLVSGAPMAMWAGSSMATHPRVPWRTSRLSGCWRRPRRPACRSRRCGGRATSPTPRPRPAGPGAGPDACSSRVARARWASILRNACTPARARRPRRAACGCPDAAPA